MGSCEVIEIRVQDANSSLCAEAYERWPDPIESSQCGVPIAGLSVSVLLAIALGRLAFVPLCTEGVKPIPSILRWASP